MQPGIPPPAGPLYSISRDELQVLEKYLENSLSKGLIQVLFLPAAALVLFVKKQESGLQFCVDYCGLNAFIIKNKYLLPLIRKTLDSLCNALYFTKLDIIAAFNKIHMTARAELKIAFKTYLNFYKYLVMPFGLANASSSFQNFINNGLKNDILDLFIIVYMDDILVFSKTFQRYREYIKTVMACLQAADLQLDIDKYKFKVHETTYLVLII